MDMTSPSKKEFNKNERQVFFNQVKGVIKEINVENGWCSYTLLVGHENQRLVNFSVSREHYDSRFADKHQIGDKVTVRFYLTSRYRNNRWHTAANILEIEPMGQTE